jgi:hypothetical protein
MKLTLEDIHTHHAIILKKLFLKKINDDDLIVHAIKTSIGYSEEDKKNLWVETNFINDPMNENLKLKPYGLIL